MKKILLFMMISLSTAQLFAGPRITISLELGKPRLDCMKVGICHFNVLANNSSSTAYSGTAWIDDATGDLNVILDREVRHAKDTRLDEARFEMTEEYVIPEQLAKELGIQSGMFVIKTGNYPIRQAGSQAFINFGH